MTPRDFIPIGSLAVGIVLAVVLHFVIPSKEMIPSLYSIMGILIIPAGFALMAYGIRTMLRAKTELRPGGQPIHLVTHGPYQYTRNPIYMGNMIILLGVCVLLGTLLPFIVIPAYFIISRTIVVPFEEKRLTATFGQEYLDYKKKVRRWL